SPDGRYIAFVSKRGSDEVNALYVIPVDSGEAEKIIELPYSVMLPKWFPDGKRVAVVTQVIPELAGKLEKADLAAMRKEIKRRKESKMTARATENRQYRFWDRNLTDNLAHRLVIVNLETKALVDLTPRWDRLFTMTSETVSFDISPDGRYVAVSMNSTPPPYRDKPNSDIYLIPTDSPDAPRNLTSENPFADEQPRFAPDSKSLVFRRRIKSHHYEHYRLWRHDLTTGRNGTLTDRLDYSFDEYAFSQDGRSLWVLAEERGFLPLYK